MDDLLAAEGAFVLGLINGLFGMFTGAVLFGAIGLAFCGVGIFLMVRGV